MTGMRRRRRDERGTAAIELVGMVPILVLITILCVQAFLVAATFSSAQKAARDAARAATLGQDARSAADDALPGWASLKSVERYGCEGYCYRVEVRVPLVVPGLVNDRVTLEREAELPDPGGS